MILTDFSCKTQVYTHNLGHTLVIYCSAYIPSHVNQWSVDRTCNIVLNYDMITMILTEFCYKTHVYTHNLPNI